jgi:hypothetical protein
VLLLVKVIEYKYDDIKNVRMGIMSISLVNLVLVKLNKVFKLLKCNFFKTHIFEFKNS